LLLFNQDFKFQPVSCSKTYPVNRVADEDRDWRFLIRTLVAAFFTVAFFPRQRGPAFHTVCKDLGL
jgi:hypothetical protein